MIIKIFLIYKLCENVFFLMGFDNTEEFFLIKEFSYESIRCVKLLLNMKNLDYYSFGIDGIYVEFDFLFI